MRSLTAALLLALGGLFLTVLPASAEDPVVTDMQIESPDEITVGDRVTYIVTIEADEGVEFTLAQSSLLPVVEMVGPLRSESRDIGEGRAEVTLTFELAIFYTGDLPMPPLALRYVGEAGPATLETPASRMFVGSVLPTGGEITPRDLKPQALIGIGSPAWIVPAISAATIALIAVATLIFWRIRRLQERPVLVPEPVVVEMSPEDSARLVLDKTGAAFGADDDFVAYYRSIGVTVRTYLTERHGFPAFALTTRELESEMLRRGLDRWQVRVAGGLLTQCDSVVYAHYRPAHERADADLTAAYEIVEMSRPAEPIPVGAPS
ncbi:MAG TPA: hypothetical protein VG845_04760 [Dehalococcoidia bacterium]|jgi:hypothetical protein|nr:hypothetical protein [Dehalococcoidia bacterium]